MIKERRMCVCVCVCSHELRAHPLLRCQSGLKVTLCRTNMCLWEFINKKEKCVFLKFYEAFVCVLVFLSHAPERQEQEKSPHQTPRPQYFHSIVCLRRGKKYPHLRCMGTDGELRPFVVVILLVVERKVSEFPAYVRGWIWCYFRRTKTSVLKKKKKKTHIRVSFPGADASQRGDLSVWCTAVLLAQLMRSHETVGLRKNTFFLNYSDVLLRLANVRHLHMVKKNAGLEQVHWRECKPQLWGWEGLGEFIHPQPFCCG